MLSRLFTTSLKSSLPLRAMSSQIREYDLISLGGGSGGLFCAKKAAQLGKRVAVIDKHKLGGRCVHAGCVPKKIIYHATMIKEDMTYGDDYGVHFSNPSIDWLKIKQVRDDHTHKMHLEYYEECKKAGIDFLHGKATFRDKNTLEVVPTCEGSPQKPILVKAPHIVVATGSRPLMPKPIDGINCCLNTDSFFALTSMPKEMFIIGGGYIGVEVACSLQAFGIKTALCMLESNIVTPLDREITDTLMNYMKEIGIKIIPEAKVRSVEKLSTGKSRISFENYCPIETEAVLCAAGIAPNTENLGLEKLGVRMDKFRNIISDDYENSSVAGIYAIGDVTGKVILTPVAKTAGEKLARRLFAGEHNAKLDYSNIPTVVFSHPPMGKVGYTEEEAVKLWGKENIKVYRHKWVQLFHAVAKHKQPSLVKLVVRMPDKKVVGIHAIGRSVDEWMQGYAVAYTAGVTKEHFEETLSIHPTESEAFVAL